MDYVWGIVIILIGKNLRYIVGDRIRNKGRVKWVGYIGFYLYFVLFGLYL